MTEVLFVTCGRRLLLGLAICDRGRCASWRLSGVLAVGWLNIVPAGRLPASGLASAAVGGADLGVGHLVGEQGADLGGLGGGVAEAAHDLGGHAAVDQFGGAWRSRWMPIPVPAAAQYFFHRLCSRRSPGTGNPPSGGGGGNGRITHDRTGGGQGADMEVIRSLAGMWALALPGVVWVIADGVVLARPGADVLASAAVLAVCALVAVVVLLLAAWRLRMVRVVVFGMGAEAAWQASDARPRLADA